MLWRQHAWGVIDWFDVDVDVLRGAGTRYRSIE